jgi:hypothetical protein
MRTMHYMVCWHAVHRLNSVFFAIVVQVSLIEQEQPEFDKDLKDLLDHIGFKVRMMMMMVVMMMMMMMMVMMVMMTRA